MREREKITNREKERERDQPVRKIGFCSVQQWGEASYPVRKDFGGGL